MDTQHSAESSDNSQIQESEKPLNQFKQQILLSKGRLTIHGSINILIKLDILLNTLENLMTILKEFLLVQPNLVTAIYCTPEDLYEIKVKLKETFTIKFSFEKMFPWVYQTRRLAKILH